MSVAGYIAGSLMGWPVVFYLYGALGIIWSLVWFVYGCDSPAKHKSISSMEKKYIEEGTGIGATREVSSSIILRFI